MNNINYLTFLSHTVIEIVHGEEANLIGSLEQFGLSKYEASAYMTLITKGTITAGELAYYASLPRTKVYPTLQKLTSKKLVVISKNKPITCTAVAPEDAFDDLVQEQINKVNGMNAIVSNLKRVNEESRKARGYEEKRYFHLNSNYLPYQLKKMIGEAKKSIHATIDSWGLGLLSHCREQLLLALRNDVDIKIVIHPSLICSEYFQYIPHETKIKTSSMVNNSLIFDDHEILIVSAHDGRGALFTSSGILGYNQINSFEQTWENATSVKQITGMDKKSAQEILKIIDVVRESGLGHTLHSVLQSKNSQIQFLEFLKQNGVNLQDKALSETMKIIDATLNITCNGRAKFDNKRKNIIVESKINSGHSLPWAMILDEYLSKKQGIQTKVIYNDKNKEGEKVYIKLSNEYNKKANK